MSFKLSVDKITPSLNKIQKDLQTVPQQAHKFFVSVTPKKSGNARNKTKLIGDTISADYPYAKRLDKGWSKQSPQGMTRPTIKFLRDLFNRIVRK